MSAAPPSSRSWPSSQWCSGLIWPKFVTAPVRSLIMAAEGDVIASIDSSVKFLAYRCWLHYNNLAFSIRSKRMEGTVTQVLVRKTNTIRLISFTVWCVFASCCFLRVKVSSAEEGKCKLHFYCLRRADERRQVDKKMTEWWNGWQHKQTGEATVGPEQRYFAAWQWSLNVLRGVCLS